MGQLGRLVELGRADLPDLQALFERCDAYFRLVHGTSARPDEAERYLLRDLPGGRGAADQVVFGLRDDEERLVGAVDLVRDWPEPGEFFLGTMIIEPSIRGVGLGAGLHAQVLGWIRAHGARAVQLAVPVPNDGALRFWARAGYQEVGRGWVHATAWREVVKMRLELDPPSVG